MEDLKNFFGCLILLGVIGLGYLFFSWIGATGTIILLLLLILANQK